MTKAGAAGLLTLNGSNTYTGVTAVTGSLALGNDKALGTGLFVISGNGILSAAGADHTLTNSGTLGVTTAAANLNVVGSQSLTLGNIQNAAFAATSATNDNSVTNSLTSGSFTIGNLALANAGTARIVTFNGGGNTVISGIASNGGTATTGTLAYTGAGALTLLGANTYLSTLITSGTVMVGNGGTVGTTGTGTIWDQGTLVFNRSNLLTATNAILTGTFAGAGNLVQLGSGTTTLTNTNTYTGTTIVSQGTLVVGNNNALPTATKTTVGAIGGATGATLDLTNFSATVASITMGSVSGTDAIVIGAGKTLTVSGTDGTTVGGQSGFNSFNNVFRVGGNVNLSATTTVLTTTAVVSGAGTLAINNPVANFALDNVATTTGTQYSILNLSGLANFNATVAAFRIGYGLSSVGILTLGTNNTITTGVLDVGNSNTQNASEANKLILGATNTINAGVINVGISKSSGTMSFNAGLTSPTLVIRGTAGGSTTADLNLANVTASTGADSNSSMIFTNTSGGSDGSINAKFGTMTIGQGSNGGNGSGHGTFEFDSGTVTADLIKLGVSLVTSLSARTSTGTLNVKGGTLTSGTIVLGTKGSATQLAAGILNLTGGTTTLTADIIDGGGGGASTLNLSGGTLDMGNHNIGSATELIDTLTLASGTLKNVAEINNGGAVSKMTAGTLVLSSSNGYTGVTNINAGTLQVDVNDALGATAGNTVVSGSGATLFLNNVNYATAEGLTLNGNGISGGGALSSSGTSTFAGAITVASNASISAGGSGKVLNLTGGVTKDGTILTFSGPGTVNVSGVGISGTSANSDLVVDGGLLVLSASSSYNGPTIVQNSGTLRLGAANVLPSSPVTDVTVNSSKFNLGGFSASIGGLSGDSGGNVLSTGISTLTVNPGGSSTYAGRIQNGTGTVSVTKDGNGTQTLSGSNTYTGATNIHAGTLLVSGSISGSSALTVGDAGNLGTSAVLGGGGTVGNVTVGAAAGNTGATLSPHAGSTSTSAGVTLHTGSVTFADGSAHLALQIGRTSAFSAGGGDGTAGGDVSDHVSTLGAVTLNGADLQLSLLTGTGYTVANGDVLFLVINGSGGAVSGTFASLNGVATDLSEGATFTFSGQDYQMTYLASFSTNQIGGGNDVALYAVPEPDTWAMLLGGFGLLAGFQRFRRRRDV